MCATENRRLRPSIRSSSPLLPSSTTKPVSCYFVLSILTIDDFITLFFSYRLKYGEPFNHSACEARSARAAFINLLRIGNEHESCYLSFAFMSLLSRLGLSGFSNYGSILQLKSSARSPPPSPNVEQRIRPREPYPVPGGNPASQYTLLEKLGTGSFGTVYKAMHNDTKQIVAIKQIGGFLTATQSKYCSS